MFGLHRKAMEPGRELLQSLKRSAGSQEPGLGLVVGLPPQLILRPIATRREWLNQSDIHFLTVWRNRFVTSFLTEFQATEEQTADWLVTVVGPNPNKILFMVDDTAGHTFGYMGLGFINWSNRTGEADAIVRGGKAPRGAMAAALKALIQWARGPLELDQIYVRVRSDNSALRFYERIGFVELRRVGLIRCEKQNEIHWKEEETSEIGSPCLVHMRYEL